MLFMVVREASAYVAPSELGFLGLNAAYKRSAPSELKSFIRAALTCLTLELIS